MINAIINGILNVINSIVSLILSPIDSLFSNFFPSFSTYITSFNTFVETYIGGTIGFFTSMLPSKFVELLQIFLFSIATYYTIRFTYNNLLRLWSVIKKLKFW